MLVFELQSIIYYTVRSPKLEQWLEDSVIQEALTPTLERSYVDLDPTFNMHVDEDFDHRLSGITRNSFCSAYLDWVQYCASRRDKVSWRNKHNFVIDVYQRNGDFRVTVVTSTLVTTWDNYQKPRNFPTVRFPK